MKDKLSPKKKPGRKNRYAGILQPRQVGTGAPEVSVVVLYDVEDDRIRARVSDICLNYGLERIQYSAFLGKINRNRRQELSLRLQEEVGAEQARLRIIPVTEDALKEMWVHDQYSRKVVTLEAGGVPRIRIVAREE
jgi:CRISPR-associated protein Cas2